MVITYQTIVVYNVLMNVLLVILQVIIVLVVINQVYIHIITKYSDNVIMSVIMDIT
jgi:hypothetical protein